MLEVPGKLVDKAFEYVDAIIKPPLKEVGGILTDQVKLWRYKNQIDIVLKVKEYHQKKGISPKKIPVKTLANLLEAASWEQNETMKQMWVNLLSNATNPDNEYDGHNTLVSLLKELNPEEALVLNHIYQKGIYKGRYLRGSSTSKNILYEMNMRNNDYKMTDSDREKESIIVDNLVRLNIIKYSKPEIYDASMRGYSEDKPKYKLKKEEKIELTSLGSKLISECTLG